MSKEIKDQQLRIQMLDLERDDFKKKYAKLKKEKLEEAQHRLQQLSKKIVSEPSKTILKKQKLSEDYELSTEILSFDMGTPQVAVIENSTEMKSQLAEEQPIMQRPKGSLLGGPKMKLNNQFQPGKG